MPKLIKIHLIFFMIAMFIAFVLIPFDHYYFDHLPIEEIKKYYRGAFDFSSTDSWKFVFTWFLGLSCGRLMLKAISGK